MVGFQAVSKQLNENPQRKLTEYFDFFKKKNLFIQKYNFVTLTRFVSFVSLLQLKVLQANQWKLFT